MALDQALLEAVAADPAAAYARTYAWSAPTLSLGYFQAFAGVEADPRWSGVPIVRRPTGGGALWHDLEVTYAVVIPGDHPSARPSRALYRAIHRAIAAELRALGLHADRRGEPMPEGTSADRPFLCFADRDDDDLVARGAKMVGSAQRRRSGAVLQHGSLLLARSPRTPELAGLSDLAPLPAAPGDWAAVLARALPDALGLRAEPAEVPAEVRRRAAALASEVYGDPAWTRRR